MSKYTVALPKGEFSAERDEPTGSGAPCIKVTFSMRDGWSAVIRLSAEHVPHIVAAMKSAASDAKGDA